jgi:hypothetical protein
MLNGNMQNCVESRHGAKAGGCNIEAGLVELRAMLVDRRLADSKRFAHVRQGLGIDPVPAPEPNARAPTCHMRTLCVRGV